MNAEDKNRRFMLVVDNNADDVDSGEFFHSFQMIPASQPGKTAIVQPDN